VPRRTGARPHKKSGRVLETRHPAPNSIEVKNIPTTESQPMQDRNQTPEDQAQLTAEPGITASETATGEEQPTGEERDVMPSLQESLRAAELKAAEHHDAWLRAKAETENVRRRAQEDIAKASKFAAEKFAAAMLPVKDSLEAALAVENQTLESLKEGVELTLKQLSSAFESAGLSEENPLDQKFDPNKHQAITTVEADREPNTVMNVLQKGYLLHERVIRPALVVVSKAKEG
jgi:molecular chaperone GrpE